MASDLFLPPRPTVQAIYAYGRGLPDAVKAEARSVIDEVEKNLSPSCAEIQPHGSASTGTDNQYSDADYFMKPSEGVTISKLAEDTWKELQRLGYSPDRKECGVSNRGTLITFPLKGSDHSVDILVTNRSNIVAGTQHFGVSSQIKAVVRFIKTARDKWQANHRGELPGLSESQSSPSLREYPRSHVILDVVKKMDAQVGPGDDRVVELLARSLEDLMNRVLQDSAIPNNNWREPRLKWIEGVLNWALGR